MNILLLDLLNKVDLHDAGVSELTIYGNELVIIFEPSELSCEGAGRSFGSEVCCRFFDIVMIQNEISGDLNKNSFEILSVSIDDDKIAFQLQEQNFSTQKIDYHRLEFTAAPVIEMLWK